MTLATMPTFSSITTAISSRIAVWPERCHSLVKLSAFSSRPNSAQSRVPARRNRWCSMPSTSMHEGVAQHVADGAGLDVGALRRQPFAAALVPIVEQLAVGRVFHFAPPVAHFRASACPRPGQRAVRGVLCSGTEQGACRSGVPARLATRRRALALNPARGWRAAGGRRRVAAPNPRGVGDVTEREGQKPSLFLL